MSEVEPVTGPINDHGEGPVWFPGEGLRWVDMLAGDVMALDPTSGGVSRWHVDDVAAVLRPRVGGGVVIAGEREFFLAEHFGGEVHSLGTVFADASLRFNEGGCDPAGNLLVGTMSYDEAPGRGTVYRLAPEGGVSVAWDAVTVSNGLGWTSAGDRAFYVDTPTGRIDVFDANGAQLSDRRPFVTIDPADGSPDGLTVDADGGVWVALWGGSAVRHYDKDGVLQQVLPIPAKNVTACTFGGDQLDQLFVTTSKQNTVPADHPMAGAVFTVEPGAVGVAVRPYAG